MSFDKSIADTLIQSLIKNPPSDKGRDGISFDFRVHDKNDVIDTVNKLIAEGKITASVEIQSDAVFVFRD